MSKISIWNIKDANAERDAVSEVLSPALAKASISTLVQNGKTIPAVDAPLSVQLAALLAAAPVVTDAQSAAEALVSNDFISAEMEKVSTELALKKTAVESLSKDKAELSEKLSLANHAVQDLTVKNSVLVQERDACSNQFAQASKAATAEKRALAQDCVDANCLSLVGENGKLMGAEATNEDKVSAAMKLSSDELRKSYKGAVNSAMAKTGVTLFAVPSAPPVASKPELTGRARFVAAGISQTQTK
jgi:septal ring factor EnvC (AmiA/AmiB activator)